GFRVEPPVSEERAANEAPMATETALPPELPPGIYHSSGLSLTARDVVKSDKSVLSQSLNFKLEFHGLYVGPKNDSEQAEPIANSSIFVLPIKTTPLSSSRSTTVALNGGT